MSSHPTLTTAPRVFTRQTHTAWQPSVFVDNPEPGTSYHVWFTLDTVTGELAAWPDFRPVRAGLSIRLSKDMWVPEYSWDYAPRYITWPGPGHEITTAVAQDVAAWMVPRAQQLLHNLQDVPGRPGLWDWTALSAAIYIAIRTVALTPAILGEGGEATDWAGQPPRWTLDRVISFEENLENNPELVNPLWADMSDEQLSKEADRLARDMFAVQPLGEKWRQPGDPPKALVGTFAGLHRWRARARDGATQITATRWMIQDFSRIPPAINADSSDADLQAIAASLNEGLAATDVNLIGTLKALRDYRAGQRTQVRRELERAGARAAEAEQEAARLRGERTALINQILAWNDDEDYAVPGVPNYAQLGRRASMTRQAIQQLFARNRPGATDES